MKECTRFSAMFATVKDLRRSGVNEDDEVRLATALFNKREVAHPNEDVGPTFRFLSCWEIMRALPKFAAAEHRAGKESEQESEQGVKNDDSEDSKGGSKGTKVGLESKISLKRKTEDRPPGRQFAKQQRALEQHRAKKLRMTSEAIALQKRHVEALERNNDIALFTQGPGGAESGMAKEFFAIQQKKRLDAMRAEAEGEKAEGGLDVLATVIVDEE